MKNNNISQLVLEKININEKDLETIINAFSAYLDKYEDNYYYNYKYLPSYKKDFYKANLLLHEFYDDSLKLNDIILKNKRFSDLIGTIQASDQDMEIRILFNRSVLFDYTKKTIKKNNNKSIIGLPNKRAWSKYNSIDINVNLEFLIQDLHFERTFYKVSEKDIDKKINIFFNETYKLILERYLEMNNLMFLCEKHQQLDKNIMFKIVIDDLLIFYPLKYKSINTLYDDSVIKFITTTDGEKNNFIIHYGEKIIKLTIKNREAIITTIKDILLSIKGES